MNYLSRCFKWMVASIVLTLLMSSASAQRPVLHIAAASDLALCIAELNAAFVTTTGPADVKVSIGSSGNFFAQIKNGAPFDVFLSADLFYPQTLAKEGLADLSSLVVYAHGQLMMWTSDANIDVRRGMDILSDPKVRRIAIANPEVAPYGRAARAALQRSGLWDALQSKMIIGDSVAQAAQFVETGNAQIGFVGASHIQRVLAESGSRVWRVPADAYPRIEQGGIVTTRGKNNPQAAQYLVFLRSEAAQAVLRKHGFVLPGPRG